MTSNVCVCVCVAVGAVTVISPLELVRTKIQSRRRPYSELLACIRSAVAQDGVLSLWRGWGPTILRDVPFSGEGSTTECRILKKNLIFSGAVSEIKQYRSIFFFKTYCLKHSDGE